MHPWKTLEEAISDVGYWRWWEPHLPHGIGLEFGGVQLWSEPESPEKPPAGMVALQFGGPKFIAFLDMPDQPESLLKDWPERLQSDQIEPFTIAYDKFTLTSPEELKEIVVSAKGKRVLFGEESAIDAIGDQDSFIAFRAGPVGCVVIAHAMRPVTFEGPLTPDEVEERHKRWWDYWKEYWQRKDTDRPMPEDYACEVTIPAEEFEKLPDDFFEKLGEK